MDKKLRVVHYLNQFFGQIGGEDKAGHRPEARDGFVGPGMALQESLGQEAEVVGTVICGDSYFNENMEEAAAHVLNLIEKYKPDVVVAGPAFNAGRYGVACGAVAKAVAEGLKVPVISGMYPENPGVDMFRRYAYIVETGDSAAGMRKALLLMARLAIKAGQGRVGMPEEDGYLARGIRQNYFAGERGARRAVAMLVEKLAGREFKTEYPMPEFDRVAPQPPVADIKKAKIALVTSGGIVPRGNPDHLESSSASKYCRYDLRGVTDLTPAAYQTAHGGYDPVYANQDPDRVLPVDAMRELEQEGKVGQLHNYYYVTVGNGTSVANAAQYAREIARELVQDGVEAVILTST